MYTNYHSHTSYCDGKEKHENYIVKAIEKGLLAYGFSSHAPVPFECKWTMKKSRVGEYLNIIDELKEKYSGQIEIYKSLEVDYIPGMVGPGSNFIKSLNLDYTIGAIHFIDNFEDGDPWNVDGSHLLFLEGVNQLFDNNMKKVVKRYFELMNEMIVKEDPTIIAHLDKIKTQNPGNKYYHTNEAWYLEEVEKCLEIIKTRDSIVEVNTRGLYTKKMEELYPNEIILKMIQERDIPVTVNADTHAPNEIDAGHEIAYRVLSKIGIKKVSALINGKWGSYSFNESGILL
ncbi:MAG: histidinol-phosphatase [bacterium]